MTFAEWKTACIQEVRDHGLSFDDLWDDDDPYELFEVAEPMFKNGVSPAEFIEEVFEEDLAHLAGVEQEQEDSLEGEFEFEEED